MNKKITILIPVLALTLLVSACAKKPVVNQNLNVNNQNISSTPTPTASPAPEDIEVIESDIDTSNWKTYRNEEFGFEVGYPEGWNVWKVPIGSQISFSPWKPNGDAPMVYISSSKDDNGLKDYEERVEMEANRWEWSSAGKKIFKEKDVILLDKKIIQYRSTSHNNEERVTFLTGRNFIYGIGFQPAGEIPLEVYNAILLTFRVIDSK